MSASSGYIGKGISVFYGDSQGSITTSIGEVLDVKPPPVDVAKVEFTHYSSDSSAAEFKTGAWKLPGDVDIECNYTAALEDLLYTTLLGVEKWWKIVYPDGTYVTFEGFVGNVGGNNPIKDRMTRTFTVRVIRNLAVS